MHNSPTMKVKQVMVQGPAHELSPGIVAGDLDS
jgi:hypothetical protein